MSVHVFNRMSLHDLANYFKESSTKQKLKTLNVVDMRNISESLQYLAKQQKQFKQHPSSKINKEDESKKLLPGGAVADYLKIFSLMNSGQKIPSKQLTKYKMEGLMDFYEKNLEKLLVINNKIEQKTQVDHYFWQLVSICVDQTFQKLTQDHNKSKTKQSFVIQSKIEPNQFLTQMNNLQTIALKDIQQYLIDSGITEKYRNYMKGIAKKNNLPSNIFGIIQEQYVKWYKVFNDLYPIFYETKPNYQDIDGKTLAEKCSWLSGQIATKIKDKSQHLIQQSGINHKYSQNLNQLFELFEKEKNNMKEELQKLFEDLQKAKQSPKRSEKNQNIEKQKPVKASTLTYGIKSSKLKSVNVNKRQVEVKQIKQKQQLTIENQKRIASLQNQIQRQNNQINQYIKQKSQNDKIISNLNKKIWNLEKDHKEKIEVITKINQQMKNTIKQNEQKIKKLQRIAIQKNKQTIQFLQKCQTLLKLKQKVTLANIYNHIEQQNKKMLKIFDKIYQMQKNENPLVQDIDEESSIDQKYKFIKQYLKIDKKLYKNTNNSSIKSEKNRKSSNNQTDYFQILSMNKQGQYKGNKDFRKQSTEMITQSYKVNRSSMGGAINKSEYSAEPEDSITQKIKQENKKLKKEIKELQQQLSQKDKQIQKIRNDLKDKQKINAQLQLQKHSPKYFKHTLFYSGMFKQILKQRFVIDNLQNHLKNNDITNFNLLHRSIDPTDLITDIQKHPNILFIALTKSGHSIAAYSSLSVCNTINTKQPKGIIMLTRSQECQQLKPKQKSVEKDNKYLTFNIGDIRLKLSITKEQQQLFIYFQTDNKQLMKKQKDQSHKQFRNSTNQTKIQLQSYQIYEIKFNENNIIQQKKELQTLQVKPNILQQDRSRSMIMDEMKSVNKKVPSQAQQIRQLKLTIERYEKSIKTLKQQNEELKGVGGNISQSYSNKRSNLRQQSKGKYNFNQSSSLINKKLTANLSLNTQKNQKETQKVVEKKQQELNILNKKYNDQGEALKSSELKLKAQSMKSNRLSSDKKQLQTNIQKKQKQIQQLKKQSDIKTKQLQSKLKTKQEQLNNLLKDSSQWRNQQSNTEELQKMRSDISNLKRQLQVQKKKTQIIQSQKKKNQEQFVKKANQYEDKIKQLQNTNKQIQTLKEEIKNINNNNYIQKQNIPKSTKKQENIEQIKLKQVLGIQLQKKKQEINSLQKRVNQLQQINGSLIEQIKNKQNKINQLNKEQKLKQTRVKLLQAQASQLNSKIVVLKKESVLPKPIAQIKSIPKEKQQSKGQLQKQKQMFQKIIKQRQQIQTQIANKQKFFRQMNQKQKRLCANIKQLEQKSSKMGKQFQKAQKVVQNMDKLQQEKLKLQENIKKLHDNISILLTQQKSKQEKLKQSQYRLNLIKKQLSEQISQKSKLQTLKKSIKQKQLQIVQKDNLSASIQNKIKQAEKTLSQYENQSYTKQKSQIDKLNKIEDQIKFNQAKLKSLQTKILSKIQGDHSVVGFHQFFVGEVVQNNPDRHFIISQVQNIMCKQIKRTKLLYTYPLMNIINPHIPLDGIPNYIVLIKMRQRNKEGKKFTIAMFSEKALEKSNIINNKRGFVCSVTNRQVFYLVKSPTNNPRVTEYNQFYIVFGNNQIIFRINSPLLQFKIGHNFKSFDTGTMKTGEIFTGSNEQKLEMEGYQIYQVMF